MSEPIEEYLDQLYARLGSEPRAARRLLAEVEAHLHERADALEQHDGLARHDAELTAVESFGAPTVIARQHAAPLSQRIARGVQSLTMLGGIGLIAVGVSGAVAAAMNALFGRAFVGNQPELYPFSTCRHFLAVQQSATTCGRAAVLENSTDAVSLRLAVGVVGLLVIGAVLLWRRIRPQDTGRVNPAIACAAFGAGALGLIGASLDLALTRGSDGVGWYLSGGLVAAIAFGCYAVPAARRLLIRA